MKFVHPRYWPIWCFFGLVRLASFFPHRWQMRAGMLTGRLLKYVVSEWVRITDTNLRLCFPEWPEDKRRALRNRHFESLGKCPFDFAIASWWSDERICHLARVEGLDNLHNALVQQRGVILLAGHFITLDITGRIMHLHTSFYPVYRKHNNPLMEAFIGGNRAMICGKAIPHDNLRSMYQALRDKMPLYYIPDQNFGRKHCVFVPFFGIQAATTTAVSRLAGKYHTPVVPVVQQRLPGDRGYLVKFREPLRNFPSGDPVQDTLRINQLLEAQIRQNPVDYLWIHRRFKTRPEGEEAIYK